MFIYKLHKDLMHKRFFIHNLFYALNFIVSYIHQTQTHSQRQRQGEWLENKRIEKISCMPKIQL